MRWNIDKILAHFNGPEDLHAQLKAAGYTLGIKTVKAWDRRGAIPAHWIAALLMLTGNNPNDWIEEDIF